jgi:hypothetical protein
MKRESLLWVIAVFAMACYAGEPRGAAAPGQKQFVEYLAGTELIMNDRSGSQKVHAEKYLKLCALTGVDEASAEVFIRSYGLRPEQWRKIQAQVLEMLQSIK